MLYCVASGGRYPKAPPYTKTGGYFHAQKEHTMWQKQRPKHVPKPLAKKIHARDSHECQIHGPGCTITSEEIDHIIPICQGGPTTPDNLRAVCKNCHRQKSRAEAIQGRRAAAMEAYYPAEPHPGRIHKTPGQRGWGAPL